jgi:acyl-[acyl-carrier-protein]-phospholipid O-acyltransferase / long-chain-fatty-acid--[acyl-carrier-protein] ligase
MMGYLNRPTETEAALRDGWYVTGDIVVMDEDGFMRIVDRQSRFSKIGGEMVPHGKIEEVLQSATAGAPCAVTLIADDRRGERLVAWVAGQGGPAGDTRNSLGCIGWGTGAASGSFGSSWVPPSCSG